jgi:hypothetical protein
VVRRGPIARPRLAIFIIENALLYTIEGRHFKQYFLAAHWQPILRFSPGVNYLPILDLEPRVYEGLEEGEELALAT